MNGSGDRAACQGVLLVARHRHAEADGGDVVDARNVEFPCAETEIETSFHVRHADPVTLLAAA